MDYTIEYYRQLRIDYCRKLNANYNPERDNSLTGCALEIAVRHFFTGKLDVKLAVKGTADVRIRNRWTDVKQGAGELSPDMMTRLLKGSGQVIYVPVVLLDQPLARQEGYVMEREDFLAALQESRALRVKESSSKRKNIPHYTIQTFWNVSKWQPHGKLLDRMVESFDNHGAVDLVDYMFSED